ncbi:MAG: glucose/sorbosone dehydrogenase [Planctomycetota bacterium]|nr:glucose/sorbosone dehydrogenase [Planctomycetota bacterium]
MTYGRFRTSLVTVVALVALAAPAARAADPKEEDYYKILTFEPPKGLVLEVGGLEWLPDGKLAVATRRGEIYLVDNPYAADPAKDAKFTVFAKGLHEILGLAHRDGWLYVSQRGEMSRIKDTDGDGKADLFETFCDGWEITGDYHEYAFGSKFDRDGNLWVALCLTGSFTSDQKFRGWALRITPDGKMIPTTSGLRSPGGLGMNAVGDMFYTENQGPWNGACALKHLEPGAFVGHPDGHAWYHLAPNLGEKPAPPKSGGRLSEEVKRIPKLRAPAVYFPYPKMGQSASGISCDLSGGKFGPFPDQLFVGDQSASTIMRVALEKVNGRYQGACFPFRQGFASGCLPSLFGKDGSLFIGETNRGWGSRGPREFALERLVWTGKVPFEVHTMKAEPDGFTLNFTEAADPKTAADPKSYKLETHTYIYQSSYGSPEVDQTHPTITKAEVSGDGKSVRLFVDKLVEGHVHELHMDGVKSTTGVPLLHKEAYYTMNAIPKASAKP